MNRKIFSLFLLTAILAISLVSAADLIQITQGNDLSRSINSTSFNIKNIYTDTVNLSMSSGDLKVSDGKGHFVHLTLLPSSVPATLAAGSTITLNGTLTIDSGFIFNPVSYAFPPININAVNVSDSAINETEQVTFKFVQNYCKYGDIGNVEITSLTDEKLDNKNSWEWRPLDKIEVVAKIRNDIGKDEDFTVEYDLYDSTSNQFVDLGDNTVDVSVDDGHSGEATLDFQIPSDIDQDHTYIFYAKAYVSGSEKKYCADVAADNDISINQESHAVVLTDISLPSSVSCGDTVELKATVNNPGSNDEKRVLVTLFNKDLGLDLRKVITSFNTGDTQDITFNFAIPANATEKTYSLDLVTRYQYHASNSGCSSDTDTACYDQDSRSDLDKDFSQSLKVEGNCKQAAATAQDNAQITATLESEAVAGKEIVVRATVTNVGSSIAAYQVLVSGYDSFATLEKEVTPNTVTLEAGKSQDVLIYLKATDKASGDYTFTVKALSGSKIKEQPVSLSVTPKKNALGNLNIFGNLQDNWFIWVIVLINVVLIVLIIVVAVRIARK